MARDAHIPKYLNQLCQQRSFERFTVFEYKYYFADRVAPCVIIEDMKIVIQMSSVLDAVSDSLLLPPR